MLNPEIATLKNNFAEEQAKARTNRALILSKKLNDEIAQKQKYSHHMRVFQSDLTRKLRVPVQAEDRYDQYCPIQ